MSEQGAHRERWAFWVRSQAALDELAALMQQVATVVGQDEPVMPIPRTLETNMRHAIYCFEESFGQLAREQKRKVEMQ
ncbi:MAG: hypothetical protein ACLQG3_14545 [Terracidiphilus sp.]